MPHLLIVFLLAALFVSGCDIFGGDDPSSPPAADSTNTQPDIQPPDGSCQPRGMACSDTIAVELSEGSRGTQLRSWNPEERSFWEIQMGPDGEVIPQASYLHAYSIENNDSVVYWFMASEQVENGEALPIEFNRFRVTPDGDTLHLAGRSERHYDADGNVTREIRYNAKNQVVEDWVVSRNAEDQETRLSVLCGPEQKEPCASTTLEFHPDYGEVSVSRKWDPASRRYWELMRDDREGFLIESESFLRVPDSLGRDSLVFWIQSVRENDTVAKGWNENIYSSENRIQEIRYFEIEFADSSLFAYEKFDTAGNRIEYMENGFVDVYNQDQNIVRAFSIGGDLHGYPIKAGFNSEDTTLYFYGDEGELLERRDVSGTEIEEQVLYEYWTGSGQFKQILSKNQ
ncbi:hypothetical protein, partial [Okeania sp. SIO1H5]|uniref:hypothetical protein n=1 Tax=Okeania sp. SIO1H5 TaxID=2607777 RepID=UPI002580C90B